MTGAARLALALALAGPPALARAAPGDPMAPPEGAVWLHYELAALHRVDDGGAPPRLHELVLAGARLHGLFTGASGIGYHVGFDLALGGTLRAAGIAYDTVLFPVGLGARLGHTGLLALGAGVGAMGAIGTIDDAVTFPLEASAELGAGPIRALARARVAYVAGAADRRGGAPSAPLGDELDATLGLRIGRRWPNDGFNTSGGGYFAGVAYRELAGARFVGLTIGYSVDLETTPRR
ncbi:MAG TPA: hypothetical protein VFT22_32400 [Kofleriaceae bacterium]|nr:hypothetical protein [Kofleriaceae bacterium]